MNPGIYFGMPDAEYRSAPGIAQSDLKNGILSMAHYKAALTHKRKQTESMSVGTLLHARIFDEAGYEKSVIVRPDGLDGRTKEGKQWAKEAEESGREPISKADSDKVEGMRESLFACQDFRDAVEAADFEVSIFWPFTLGGAAMRKGRLDIVPRDGRAVCDIKTCQVGANKSAESWGKEVFNYGYHIQSAYYLDLLNDAVGSPDRDLFIHFTVESEPPHCVSVFSIDEDAIKHGRRQYVDLLAKVIECTDTGVWPGYSAEIQTVQLPRWVINT